MSLLHLLTLNQSPALVRLADYCFNSHFHSVYRRLSLNYQKCIHLDYFNKVYIQKVQYIDVDV